MSPIDPSSAQPVSRQADRRSAGLWVRRGLTLIALGVVAYLFWPLIGELRKVLDLLRTAAWEWVGLAVLIQFLSYSSLAGLNYLLLRPFQGRIGFWQLMAVLPAIAFIEVALPSAGASGVVLRARFLRRSGFPVEASTFSLVLETLYLAVFMIVISLSGLWYLLRSGELGLGQLILLSGLTAVVLGIGILVYRAAGQRQRGKAWAGWMLAGWNRLMARLHRTPYPPESLDLRLEGFYDGLSRLGRMPRWPFLAAASGRVVLDVVSLGACFAAFHYAISPGILLTGYGLILVFSGLSALPGGLGLVDASLAVIYARLGAPGAVAVAAALTYRLIAFWLLRFVGFVTWQVLEGRG